MSKVKKILMVIVGVLILLVIILVICLFNVNNGNKTSNSNKTNSKEELKELPKPEITGGIRGELGIDKNINESNIDDYLNRSDAVYRDMRMLEDPGNYEAIGGDRYLSGYVKGFEVVSLPYIIPVTGLPEEVGDTYQGDTLFSYKDGKYIANFEESMSILEELFPKDKVIFLMCGGGGYAGMTKNLLVSLGWNEDKIYNVGGYWYYEGKNNIEVKKEVDGKITYDFDSVPYHNIEFDKLTKSSNYTPNKINVRELKINTSKIKLEEGQSFQLNVIVLPNEATNKQIKWSSSNNGVATVTKDGLVKGTGAGTAVITATALDNNKTITCEVIVKKTKPNTQIKLDDVSKEVNEFASYDLKKLTKDFENKVYYEDGSPKEEYFIIYEDGSMEGNDLWLKEFNKYEATWNQYEKNRANILNKLIKEKKSFILLIERKSCTGNEYSIIQNAPKILKQNNYSYFVFGEQPATDEKILEYLLIDFDEFVGANLVIIKDGKIYASINMNKNSIKNDDELKSWLNKYIDIR